MKKTRNEAAVGLFVILGFVMLSLVVFFVSGVYLFRPGYALNVMYDYVSILDKGAPVRMAGVRVGEVSRVNLVYDEHEQKSRVRVKLFIEKGVEIRENYLFKIQGTHILSEPHIEISPQPGSGQIVRDGKVFEGVALEPIEALIDRAQEIAENLSKILNGLREGLEDKETADALKRLVVNLANVSQSLEKALGGSEEDVQNSIRNMKSSTESLAAILDAVEKGEGTTGKLIMEDELYQEMRAFVAEIKAHPWKLLKKDGGGRKFLFF